MRAAPQQRVLFHAKAFTCEKTTSMCFLKEFVLQQPSFSRQRKRNSVENSVITATRFNEHGDSQQIKTLSNQFNETFADQPTRRERSYCWTCRGKLGRQMGQHLQRQLGHERSDSCLPTARIGIRFHGDEGLSFSSICFQQNLIYLRLTSLSPEQ